MPEDLQRQIVSYHGWDNVCRGGLIVPHPGDPSICVPVPRLSGGVQVRLWKTTAPQLYDE